MPVYVMRISHELSAGDADKVIRDYLDGVEISGEVKISGYGGEQPPERIHVRWKHTGRGEPVSPQHPGFKYYCNTVFDRRLIQKLTVREVISIVKEIAKEVEPDVDHGKFVRCEIDQPDTFASTDVLCEEQVKNE